VCPALPSHFRIIVWARWLLMDDLVGSGPMCSGVERKRSTGLI
jgi:hypothetical protein